MAFASIAAGVSAIASAAATAGTAALGAVGSLAGGALAGVGSGASALGLTSLGTGLTGAGTATAGALGGSTTGLIGSAAGGITGLAPTAISMLLKPGATAGAGGAARQAATGNLRNAMGAAQEAGGIGETISESITPQLSGQMGKAVQANLPDPSAQLDSMEAATNRAITPNFQSQSAPQSPGATPGVGLGVTGNNMLGGVMEMGGGLASTLGQQYLMKALGPKSGGKSRRTSAGRDSISSIAALKGATGPSLRPGQQGQQRGQNANQALQMLLNMNNQMGGR